MEMQPQRAQVQPQTNTFFSDINVTGLQINVVYGTYCNELTLPAMIVPIPYLSKLLNAAPLPKKKLHHWLQVDFGVPLVISIR